MKLVEYLNAHGEIGMAAARSHSSLWYPKTRF